MHFYASKNFVYWANIRIIMRMKPKLTSNLIMRVDESLKTRLAKIQDETGCSISELARQCLYSVADYYESHKCITLPVAVIPQKELAAMRRHQAKKTP